MTHVQRLADSCVLLTTDSGTTLFDPGVFAYDAVDLDSIGDVQRLLITHEHGDHVHPDFVKWLVDRKKDLTVHGNANVAALLEPHGIQVVDENPGGVTSEDVTHETLPNGSAPPNRSYTVDGAFTHPGDSHEPAQCADVLALPLLAPWGSMTASVQFAKKLSPRVVVPIHDFFMNEKGGGFLFNMAKHVLGQADIEFVPLGWGESATF
jgi:L-ascorbate metabolism protein UlaG (beta-lactamase superfamily)